MENILLPSTIKEKKGDHENHDLIEISPCYFGYGTTLGNALRRVLLSSLPGAAVISVKIKGAQHEFSPIENVLEDTLDILLNFKQLKLKIFTEIDEPIRLTIKKKGKGPVTGADVTADSNVEIVSKDLVLATLTTDDAEFDAEFLVQKGLGYESTDKRIEPLNEVGLMHIDAIYSPIVNVGYKVDDMRVGKITDFDKLVMSIETDGTLTPRESLAKAATILIDYCSVLTDNKESIKKEAKVEVEAELNTEEDGK